MRLMPGKLALTSGRPSAAKTDVKCILRDAQYAVASSGGHLDQVMEQQVQQAATGSTGANGNGSVVISGGGRINLPDSCFNIWGNVKKKCRIKYGVDKHGNPVGGGVIVRGGVNTGNGPSGNRTYNVGGVIFSCAYTVSYE